MVIVFIFLQTFIETQASQFKAHVIALEAPVFRIEDATSPVIHYQRKGDEIIVHPEEFNETRYDYLGSNITDDEKIRENEEFNRNHPDPMFEEEINNISRNKKFVKIIDRLGRDAFILREHVEIDYKDTREFQQEKPPFDNTDYRIAEPLPRNYPLITPGGYRGSFTVGWGAQNETNYPYQENIKSKGYGFRTELNGVWSKRAQFDKEKRFYHGGMLSYSSTYNKFVTKSFESIEENQRLALGPYLSYDPFRNEKYTFTIYGSLLFHLRNSTDIKINDVQEGNKSETTYSANNFALKIGTFFQKDKITGDLDFITGFNFHFDPAHETKTNDNLNNNRVLNNDSYTKDFTMELSLFLGLQSDY
jgi:hypothetical protein